MSVNEKMTAIADAIRGKTGKTDRLTLDQMAAEIAGITGGGGGGLAYDMGEFVLDADVSHKYTSAGIPHQLGEVPDFVLIWTDDFADLSAENVNPYNDGAISVGYIWLNGLTGLTQRLSSTVNTDYGLFSPMYIAKAGYALSFTPPASMAYCINEGLLPTNEKIGLVLLGAANTYKYRAGVTYKYFVSKAWWNVGGVANAE